MNALKEDVVISGMSGRFPESSTILEFENNLYDGVDMVTEDDRRWPPGLYDLPIRSGKLKNLMEFDASFFNMAPKQANCMDPQIRILLEVTTEAIFDAGIHPNSLKGKNIGVYVGVTTSESEQYFLEDPETITGYELTGCLKSMFANRVSYAFDFKGPSYAVDTACSSSLVALHAAWKAVNNGEIEGAIVAGTQLCLKPEIALTFNRLNMLSKDGCCKSFDANCNGYVRSEAVAAVFVQRSQDAPRVYAHILQALINTNGNDANGITFPSSKIQARLLREVYTNAEIDPSTVAYVESHGTGTKVGDPQEVKAIAEVFCHNRTDSLLIGSVKSNMGHAEPSSGVCSLIKVLLTMKNRNIPANLHYHNTNPDLKAIIDGRLKVVNKNTTLPGRLVGINSFGLGGTNAHVILKAPANPPRKSSESYLESQNKHIIKDGDLPRLVVGIGRTKESVHKILKEFQASRNENFASLLDNIADADFSSVAYPYRGYTAVGGNSDVEVFNISETPVEPSELWLVFSGMGSQWPGCGTPFMGIPPFAAAIQKCRSVLLPFGVDVLDVITREDPDSMSTTAVGIAIAAVQIGWVDVLKAVGLKNFDGYIGHSIGELGCGYIDGALTAEQTILIAYWRGQAIDEADLPEGGMAVVGLSVEEAEKWCKDHASAVVIACHNSSNIVTISGPKEEVVLIKEKLDSEGIFCHPVNSGGIAYHHPSVRKAAPKLLNELNKIILHPVERSAKWKSSSFSEENWKVGIARKASAEYLVHNLVSPVLFSEALQKIPKNARVIEVSPHALLQAVLKRALPTCTHIPLVRKDVKDSFIHLLQGLGKLFVSGERMKISALYPCQNRPVTLATPSIASTVSWDHSNEWKVVKYSSASTTKEFTVTIDLTDEESSYYKGHSIDGRVLFPATGYMVLVWRALAKLVDQKWETLPVTFSDIILHQATVLTSSNPVNFTVRLLLKKGEFEVVAGDGIAASGKIHVGIKNDPAVKSIMDAMKTPEGLGLVKEEVYRELKLRGYHYKGIFKGVKHADINGSFGSLEWKNNWVSFLDTMLQFSLLSSSNKGLYLPTGIRKVLIDPAKVLHNIDDKSITIRHNSKIGITRCNGIEIHGLKATMAPRISPADEPILETYTFVPNKIPIKHKLSTEHDEQTLIGFLINLVVENSSSLKLKIAHIHCSNAYQKHSGQNNISSRLVMANAICNSFKTQMTTSFLYSLLNTGNRLSAEERKAFESMGIDLVKGLDVDLLSKLNLYVMTNSNSDLGDEIEHLGIGSTVLVDSIEARNSLLLNLDFVVIGSVEAHNLYLIKRKSTETEHDTMVIVDDPVNFEWIETLKQKVDSFADRPMWLISRKDPLSGLLGFYKCLRRELARSKIRCIIDQENRAPLGSSLWKRIMSEDLSINIIKNGVLGTMIHLPFPTLDSKPSEHSYLNVLTRGDLSSLTWLSARVPIPESNKESVICSVKYASLNFRDIMLASGKLPPGALPGNLSQRECILGLEFAGIAEDESRVMGLIAAGGLSTTVRADPLFMWKVPKKWTLEEAASVPVVYVTAYYSLVIRGNLKRGESVLIHAGSGGVGLAAISIALSRGCTVYTTVSSVKKKEFLKQRFPQLTDVNFANSRDSTFEYHVLEQTIGKGVDVVLNSLAGDLLQASVRCLKEHGRFLEIGKTDLANNTALGMSIFLKNITFHGILLDSLIEGTNDKKLELQKLLYKGIEMGEVKPLPVTCYTYDAAEEAFRFMASGKHIGKVVLNIEAAENDKTGKKTKKGISSVYRLWPKSNLVYVITGGLGGLGLEIADWLVGRGASKLVLTSRRGITTGYQALCVKRWRSQGISVNISTHDCATKEITEKLLRESSKIGSVGGIFHLAAVLEDNFFENQTAETFRNVCKPKADGAKYLDTVSRALCPDIHLWVTFSSIVCGRGNATQTNYGWANCVVENIVEQRKIAGLPATAIQFSGIGDVGVMAKNFGDDFKVLETKQQSVRSVLHCLDNLIGSGYPVVSSLCLESKSQSGKNGKGAKSLVALIANILSVRDATRMPMGTSFGDLGLDSLTAIEIKQTLERKADLIISADDIRNLTMSKLQEMETGSVAITKDIEREQRSTG